MHHVRTLKGLPWRHGPRTIPPETANYDGVLNPAGHHRRGRVRRRLWEYATLGATSQFPLRFLRVAAYIRGL